MNDSTLTRRDLHRLALAAAGGLLSGALVGCGGKPTDQGKEEEQKTMVNPSVAAEKVSRLLQDPHICRGINTCKNKGKAGTTNECAGQGHCATVADNDCQGMNNCKGQGACGLHPGENDCKGKGACNIPMNDKIWPKARKRFEELMTKAGKKFGAAPPKQE